MTTTSATNVYLRPLAQLAGLLLLAVLLAVPTSCEETQTPHHYSNSKHLFMWDPTANSRCLVHEGDMTLVKPECRKRGDTEKQEDPKRSKRLVYLDSLLWENGVIPYTFGPYYTESNMEVVVKAMSHFEEHTCLRFKERTDEVDHVEFHKGFGCKSFIGRVTGKQGVSLLTSCLQEFGTVLHEIGHSIGLVHEHTRPDRDDYVDVLYDNIHEGIETEFWKVNEAEVDTLGIGYDYNSIMHYDADTFGKGESLTIIAKDDKIKVGMATALSELDIKKINTLYNCPENPADFPPRSTVYVPPPPPPVPPRRFEHGFFHDDLVEGKISSPEYPNYAKNQDCQWQLQASTGFQIKLDITSLDLHESASCAENYIDIYESLDCTGYRRARICSSNSFRTYYTFGNTACILYHSEEPESSEGLKGFELEYSRDDVDECLYSAQLCDGPCVNTPGDHACSCPDGYFLAADGHSCFDLNECALEEHNICDHKCVNYGGYHECVCPDGSLQKGDSCDSNNVKEEILTIETLTLETSETGVEAVKLISETAKPPSIAATTATTPLPTTITTTAATTTETAPTTLPPTTLPPTTLPPTTLPPTTHSPTTLPPTTTPTVATTVPPTECPPVSLPSDQPSCGAVLTADSGTISSPNWPLTYNVNEECEWIIVLPDCTKGIEITFSALRIAGQMPDCVKDQVYVREGLGSEEKEEEKEGKSQGPFCHMKAPAPVKLNSHVGKVSFSAGPAHGRRRTGFFATYRSIDIDHEVPEQ